MADALPHFAIIAWDAPGAAGPRDTARDAHFRHVEATMDGIAIAGPMRDAEGRFTGSLVIVRAANADEALARLQSDPYYAAGVWKRFEIHAFTPAAGSWIGGKIW
jgi:uncharacterized protein YciI